MLPAAVVISVLEAVVISGSSSQFVRHHSLFVISGSSSQFVKKQTSGQRQRAAITYPGGPALAKCQTDNRARGFPPNAHRRN
jgi:hypothetical protein